MEHLRQQLRRRAIVLEIGGFRPSRAINESYFGAVNLCAPGEEWPTCAGEPMWPLCQINLTNLPFRPPRLDDIDFITVFIGPVNLPDDSPNGERWCLRAYRKLDALVPLAKRTTQSKAKALPMRPRIVEDDFPCHEDIPIELPPDIRDRYHDLFWNTGGFKLGGWPTLVQAEIFWAPHNRHPAAPEFVFQIDSTEKGNWFWGDSGVGYFGRGTAPGKRDEWLISWQCY